ncbi:polysaccharide pyruvyl transferase family protein [Leucobacter celer]|uniref:polysaccharide pyruvyl transferase family protein n=1 Tax=Leucobacter celer TaxID=668625 RepID=UPI0006A79011|nr:polysaccharide pyruvyl transferase family protein [Leucobacter celer]
MTVYLAHGAKKNVGDYLIHSRARKLWTHVVPGAELVSIPRWEKIDLPEDAQLLVLCGGPGFTPRMVEGVFPVVQNALERSVPVSGLALGWQGLPKRNPGSFAMTARSVSTLRSIADAGAPISVRDDVTQEIAQQFGIETVRTGCSAWYSVPHLGTDPAPPTEEPRTIVYTTPAHAANTRESISVMRMLRKKFPGANLIATFHRGIRPDAQTTRRQSLPLVTQAAAARALGFEVRDVAYDLEKIGFYRDVDLHVGYRVHAHLDFVSRRTPSVLISEDGRGFGQTATLHGKKQVLWAGGSQLVEKLDRRLSNELKAGWPSLTRAVSVIEDTYPVMRETILQQARL